MKQSAVRITVLATLSLLLLSLLAAPAAAQGHPNMLLDVAISKIGIFSTLFTATTCTGVAPLLESDRDLTVFAPTNVAFRELGLTGANVCSADLGERSLVDILLYHVVAGRQTSDKVLAAERIRTLNGRFITPSLDGGVPFANDAQIVTPDVLAANGVIHVIDKVLLP